MADDAGQASTPEVGPGDPGGGRPKVVKGKAPIRRPDVDTLFSINADGSRNAIHPADVQGRFQVRKDLLWALLLAIFLVTPWVKIGGYPALLIDLPRRHFSLLGSSFNAQDAWLLFFVIAGLGFLLFVIAALWGRLWCGFTCPQTIFVEGVYRRIERWIEGPPAARAKLDKAPLKDKLARRGLKLAVFLVLTLIVTHTFLGYFMPIEEVVAGATLSPSEHPAAFLFVLVATGLLFVDFTWFREQLCIVICPYGRLQGALYDADTVNVGYDRQRGEPRGPAGKEGAGDCVDCYRCVAVCPTGIDIRNGTQLECIGCANCVDACDAIMDKLGRARGLVRYDSQRGFETGKRRLVRGRVFLYAIVLCLLVFGFAFATTLRKPFEANLIRAQGTTYTLADGRVQGQFELHLVNKLAGARTFMIAATGPEDAEFIIPLPEVTLERLADVRLPIRVSVPAADYRRGLRCELVVRCVDGDRTLSMQAGAPMLGPVRRTDK